MSNLIVQMQASIDGFVDSEVAGSSWQQWDWGPESPWSQDLLEAFNSTIDAVAGILLSRPMVQGGYLDHWRAVAEQTRGDEGYRFAARVLEVPKFVVTSDDAPGSWPRTTVLDTRGGLTGAVGTARDLAGGDLLCFGGAGLANGLLSADVVDEVQLYVNPGVAGAGHRIFDPSMVGRAWQLAGAQAHDCGIIVCRWRRQDRAHE